MVSNGFIFGVLPAVLVGFYASGRWFGVKAAAVLSLAGHMFYARWRPRNLSILVSEAITFMQRGKAAFLVFGS